MGTLQTGGPYVAATIMIYTSLNKSKTILCVMVYTTFDAYQAAAFATRVQT